MTDFSSLTTPGINDLHPYVPGKPIEELERELGLSGTIKLASNENPLGPSPLGMEAAARTITHINLYPDDSGYRLKAKLADKYGLLAEQLVLGAGSSDVIDMVARTFLAPGSNAVISRYSFAMYPIYTTAAGAHCRVAEAYSPEHQSMPYGHDLQAMASLVDEDTRVVFIANPNNPTGTWLPVGALKNFIQDLPPETVVVLDEAYTEYVTEQEFPDGVNWLKEFPNLIVTRTFSKIYGLAGLRIGYGMANAELSDLIQRVRHPFNVNMPALAAAEAALDDEGFLQQSRETNAVGLAQLTSGFAAMGLSWIPSIGNFITVNLQRDGAEVYQRLLEKGVIVRPVANYDLPEHIRVTVGTETENQRFLEALQEVLAA
ncbi:MAG TPA: histidinol-phosphate transaminase [Thiolapillus brandeum]|uniref:Histidinol-phosphate aminotransferase n=1 Tax=Thiolapillus brandeum TaxID=1076588 RepID=A0A831NYE6_9GAMM|nr:histidinol-phosphate transaminase [Thiolapillus brandeum]